MRRCLLDVPEGDSGIEGRGDERVSQRMRRDPLVDPGSLGQAAHYAGGGVTVQASGPVPVHQDRTVVTFVDAKVDGPARAWRQRDGDDGSAFAGDRQGAMPPHHPEVF